MDSRTKMFLLGITAVLCSAIISQANPNPMLCSRIYKLGGPSAMLNAPECSYLNTIHPATFCLPHPFNGLYVYPDRFFCGLHLDIPLDGDKGTAEGVRIVGSAVFDRKNRTEIWENESHLGALIRYFSRHVQLLVQAKEFTGKFADSFHIRLLEEALMRTAKDANAIFISEAYRRKLGLSGSGGTTTATITLSVNGQILVANIGHPMTAVWSMKLHPWGEGKLLYEKNRNGVPSNDEDDALNFVETGFTWHALKDLPENHIQDGRSWIQSAFDPRWQVIGILSNNPGDGDTVDMASNEAAKASKRVGKFHMIERMILREDCSLLFPKGANTEQKKSSKELVVSSVIMRDNVGELAAAVVIPPPQTRR